jgi:hypothetical protein
MKLIRSLTPVKTKFNLIRVGSANDGGYLLPNDLENISTCFSPGVGTEASFEKDLKDRFGIGSHLADYSVSKPPEGAYSKTFIKKYIGVNDNEMYISLDNWVRAQWEFGLPGDFILQMDIEGGEYGSIISTPDDILKCFRVVIMEIHHVDDWGHPRFFELVEAFFEKLQRHFHIVHLHPNNNRGLVNLGAIQCPEVFEITLLRKDRSDASDFVAGLPHELDSSNNPRLDNLNFPRPWLGIV